MEKLPAPSWSMRCKAARIIAVLQGSIAKPANPKIRDMIGLRNVAYVAWIGHNRMYGDKYIPGKALEQTLAYYEQHKTEVPFVGQRI